MKICKKFVLLAFISVFLILPTLVTGSVTQAINEQTAIEDPIAQFPQVGKFYALAGRSVLWQVIDGRNATTEYFDELHKWSIKEVVDQVAVVNRTFTEICTRPQTGENHTDTYDIDYEIAANRTILSGYWKVMSFDTTGFRGFGEGPLDEDVGEHTWAWFPTDLSVGSFVLVSWSWDRRFLGDTLYEVAGDETIEVLGEKQDSWMVNMPPVVTIDGTQGRTETYWVDKDTGIPLKFLSRGWALDESFGWEDEAVLANTNINLGPESTQTPSPTYTLTASTTLGFPEAAKFYTVYDIETGWYMSGLTNVTWHADILVSWCVVNVTGNEALVFRTLWYNEVNEREGVDELEAVMVRYFTYRLNTITREILDISAVSYSVNMTALTYAGPQDLTPQLAGDIGEETQCWLPTNLYLGALVDISWSFDRPYQLDNATYTVTDEKITSALGQPQASWTLYLPPIVSTDGTWNYTETWHSDKDTGIPLHTLAKSEAVDGSSAYVDTVRLMNTNVDLGPTTHVFPVAVGDQTFQTTVITNSTLQSQTFNFSQKYMTIAYSVSGPLNTTGFCNVTVPKGLMKGEPWTILVDETPATDFTQTANDTHTFLHFTYNHSTHEIRVMGTWVVPEFSSTVLMPLYTLLTTLAVIFMKRRFPRKPKTNSKAYFLCGRICHTR